jgi:uncharacterized protein YdeI (YjbR/CyaY-like superfamily)
MGVEDGIQINSDDEFDTWLAEHGKSAREIWVVIFKKASKKQTVTPNELLEVAITRGWIDVQTKSLDEERYGIRFVPRKLESNWSATNRSIVMRLLAEGRMTPEGAALLPDDL